MNKEYNYSIVGGSFDTSGTAYGKDLAEVLLGLMEWVKDRNLKDVKIEIKENE